MQGYDKGKMRRSSQYSQILNANDYSHERCHGAVSCAECHGSILI